MVPESSERVVPVLHLVAIEDTGSRPPYTAKRVRILAARVLEVDK
jgi:hypothetical protein